MDPITIQNLTHVRHLFIAPAKGPWGELVLGLRVAAELAERGEEIVFLVAREHELLLAGLPYQVEYIEDVFRFDARVSVPQAIARFACDTIVLIDLTVFFYHLRYIRSDATFFSRIDVPVLALDIWNVPGGSRTLDFADVGYVTSRHALSIRKRLVPVPFIAPLADPGCFNALPAVTPVSHAERAEARAALGVGEAPLILTTTASWQLRKSQAGNSHIERNAAVYPGLVAGHLAQLGERLHVVHVGPEPTAEYEAALGSRYHHRVSMSQPEFRRLLAAADLFLTFNLPATAIGSAIGAGIPTLVGTNSYTGSADAVRALLPRCGPRVSEWLRSAAPLYRFRAWPYGYYDFMATILENNPYLDAIRVVEVIDEDQFLHAANELLYVPRAREEAREKLAAYRALAEVLPSASDLFLRLLEEP